ncbi:uncharacterized protein K452DRAFT_310956 [Aplosporella prunicola CBS 121167]|uniref:Uncharacterized protein n=1 Tax=Aplosporella prunicola CBS 121167 TaxID=1176127 RepID=A0A6A6B6Y0_9PEZI|nr:uncharacterized protein K452DRAFT_310956 [Aplosporella prunicola CBS 121167]KAF2138994.1 hypothetical protein K452DRAFT_310956 [Aplosporella prunicola CBS 121167]
MTNDHQGPHLVATSPISYDKYFNGTLENNRQQTTLTEKVDERVVQMREQWEKSTRKYQDASSGYAQVAVLIVKWADHLDNLNCKDEVVRINGLFRDSFNFETKIVELDIKRKPDHQLHSAMSLFIEEFDGANNLLIIYYTGHAAYNEDSRELEFFASDSEKDFIEDAAEIKARAKWTSAEKGILDGPLEADALAILDTCYASNADSKGDNLGGRAYQLLAATGLDKQTNAPGPKSFTTAFIQSAKECLEEKGTFSLWGICNRINRRPERRNEPSHFYDRMKHYDRQIFLTPLAKDKTKREEEKKRINQRPSAAFLVLEFGLEKKYLDGKEIEATVKHLTDAYKTSKLGTQNIRWLGYRPRRTLSQTVGPAMLLGKWRRQTLSRASQKPLTFGSPVNQADERTVIMEEAAQDLLKEKENDGTGLHDHDRHLFHAEISLEGPCDKIINHTADPFNKQSARRNSAANSSSQRSTRQNSLAEPESQHVTGPDGLMKAIPPTDVNRPLSDKMVYFGVVIALTVLVIKGDPVGFVAAAFLWQTVNTLLGRLYSGFGRGSHGFS